MPPKIDANFFQDRIVSKASAHIKAFASEMLTAIAILGIFVDAVVRPMGILRPHVDCFDKLREIVGVLGKGDEACSNVGILKIKLQEHHVRFQGLYPNCIKPKLHYLKHAIDGLEKFGCNLNCFAPERKHKEAKAIAAYSFNKAMPTKRNSTHSLTKLNCMKKYHIVWTGWNVTHKYYCVLDLHFDCLIICFNICCHNVCCFCCEKLRLTKGWALHIAPSSVFIVGGFGKTRGHP